MNAFPAISDAFQDDRIPARPRPLGSHEAFTSHRVIVDSPRSSWVRALDARFEEITSLQRGWDGYDGRPVSFRCASFAANMLERLCREDVPPPSLVPGSDGTLQIEWHRNQYDVEIDIIAPQHAVAMRYDRRTDEVVETEVRSDFSKIADWISALADPND